MANITFRSLYPPGKSPGTHLQEVGWTPGTVWTGAENLTPHRDSAPGPSSTERVVRAECTSFKGGRLQMLQLNVTAVRIVTTTASRIWQKQEQWAALRGYCVSAVRAYVVLRGFERYGCPTKTLPIRIRFPPAPTACCSQAWRL